MWHVHRPSDCSVMNDLILKKNTLNLDVNIKVIFESSYSSITNYWITVTCMQLCVFTFIQINYDWWSPKAGLITI